MKTLVTLLAVLFSMQSYGQLLNGNFQETTTDEYGYTVPAHWDTNNNAEFERCRISDSEDDTVELYPRSETAWFDCESRMWQGIALEDALLEGSRVYIDYILYSLDTSEAHFIVEALAYQNGSYLGRDQWQGQELWSQQVSSFPLTYMEADSLAIRVISGAVNGAADGCHNPTIGIVYSVRLALGGSTTSTAQTPAADISIYPNPAFGYLTIAGDVEQISSYQIYNSTGALIQSGPGYHDSIKLQHSGLLLLSVTYQNGRSQSYKIMNNGM